MAQKKSSERLVRDIKRNTRRKFSSEEKIRIVIDGLRGETSIAELCRREGIAQKLYYRWSKPSLNFMLPGFRTLLTINTEIYNYCVATSHSSGHSSPDSIR